MLNSGGKRKSQTSIQNIVYQDSSVKGDKALFHNCPKRIRAIFQPKFISYLNNLNSSMRLSKNNSRTNSQQKSRSPKRRPSQARYQGAGVEAVIQKQNDCPNQRNSFQSLENSMGKMKKSIKRKKSDGSLSIQFEDGSVLSGSTNNGEVIHGKMKFRNGISYIGQLKNLKFEGRGIVKLINGTQFHAQFVNGQIDKVGQIHYSNGDHYVGDIKNYKKHGQGEMKFINGNRYVGSFTDGEICGYGVYYCGDKVLAEGLWKNGELCKGLNK